MENHQWSVFPKALQEVQNQLVSDCNKGMLSKSSNGCCCSWVRKICFHSFHCFCVWGNSCRQDTYSQGNHSIGYDTKRNKYAPEWHKKKKSSSIESAVVHGVSTVPKRQSFIHGTFSVSAWMIKGKLFALFTIKEWILTNLESMLAHLYLFSICKYCSQCIPAIAAKIQ